MPTDRPNVVFIITDQQRLDTIGALGHGHMHTPNLDRLVAEGVTFTNCHITSPSCAPSRASLFTGLYPHTTGIYTNGDQWRHSWVEALSEAGYHTVNVGKMHTAPYGTALGFDERYVVENKDRYLAPVPGEDPPLPSEKFYLDEWDKALAARGLVKQQREMYRHWEDYEERMGAFEWELPEDAHPDVFVGEMAVHWLDAMPKLERPLFLQVGFPGPHPPFDPVGRHVEKYVDAELPSPILSEEDLAGQPPPLKALRDHHTEIDHDSTLHRIDPDEELRHRQRAYYYANVSMIDEQVGEIVRALKTNGYEDTVVVFTSDHGEALGDHGHVQKQSMYDVITRVPAIVWSPDRFEPDSVPDLVSLFDLGATVLDFAGVERPGYMEAETLRPRIEGSSDPSGREYVFAEHSRSGILQETAFMTMVRSEDWKLVHFLEGDYGQLFDLRDDPEETHNLWDDPDAGEKKRELLDVLLEWRVESGVRTAEWAADFR